MSPAAVFFLLVIVGSMVLAGWGRIFCWMAGMRDLPLAVTAAVGLGGLLFIGGILNAMKLAIPGCIDGLVLLGLGAALFFALRPPRWRRLPWRWSHAVAALVVGLAGGFVLLHLMPAKAYNWADDFERYFSYPLRMLQTGTIGGNPLGVAGIDTLGGQAFLQAFIVRYFPLDYLGALESPLALLLCLALAISPGRGGRAAAVSAAALLALIAIDPEVVNISSIYTTSALIMAACVLAKFAFGPGAGYPPFVLLGLLYAGLLALKSTNVIFVAVHFGLLLAINAGAKLGPRVSPRQWGCAAVSALLAVLPWAAAHLPLYWAALGSPAPVPPPFVAPEPYRYLFSAAGSIYGTPELPLTLTVLAEAVIAGGLFAAVKKKGLAASPAVLSAMAAGAGSAIYYGFLVLFCAPRLFGQLTSLRYCCPVLIATVPVMLVLAAEADGPTRLRRPWAVAVAGGAAIFALFFCPLRARLQQMARQGCSLAYLRAAPNALAAGNLQYDREVLHGNTRLSYRKIQALVPPGEPIIVWTMASFWFDFARNPILNTDPSGLAIRRKAFPRARYIVLQYSGTGVRDRPAIDELRHFPATQMRMIGASVLEFVAWMHATEKDSDVLFNDGQYLLLRRRS